MNETALREHLTQLLKGGSAHTEMEKALREYSSSKGGISVPGSVHTAWQLLEHIRIAQWDIVEFSRDPDHVSPKFPDGYWPDSETPLNEDAWGRSVELILKGLHSIIELVRDPAVDLFEPIPHGDGQTVLREALLVANHNAYHLGQLMMLRRVLE